MKNLSRLSETTRFIFEIESPNDFALYFPASSTRNKYFMIFIGELCDLMAYN